MGFGIASTYCYANPLAPLDSIRQETIGGKPYVLHRVDAGQTLFGLARKYKVSPLAIKSANPTLKDALTVGEVIKIPVSVSKVIPPKAAYKKSKATVTEEEESDETESTQGSSPVDGAPVSLSKHIVVKGDNLFAIARKYNVSVSDLRKWNKISNAGLQVGQELLVSDASKSTSKADLPKNQVPDAPKNPIKPQDKAAVEPTPTPVEQPKPTSPSKVLEEKPSTPAKEPSERISEKGQAELIDDKTNLHVGLHREAQEGSLMIVRNELNGQSVQVKVIGKLPDTGQNDKIVVKISRKAFEALGGTSKRFPVQVTYTK